MRIAPLFALCGLTLIAMACGVEKHKKSHDPVTPTEDGGFRTTVNPPDSSAVDYKFNLQMKGKCEQTNRPVTLSMFSDGSYSVTDDNDTFREKSGAYVYDPKTRTTSFKPAAFVPNEPALLDGSCFERGGLFICSFKSSILNCSTVNFGSYQPVQVQIDHCESGH